MKQLRQPIHSTTETYGKAGLKLAIAVALSAAFLLVPAAQAFANATMKINMAGTGQGEVNSGFLGPFSGLTELQGNPPIECSYSSPGPAAGQCENEFLSTLFGDERMALRAKPAAGSEFVGWTVEKGTDVTEGEDGGTCANGPQTAKEHELEESEAVEPGERVCYIRPDVQGTGEAEVTATFVATGVTTFPLTLTTSGTGSGSFECEDITAATAAGPCASGVEFPENDEVEVIPVEAAGSEFVEFNAENGGECAGATCTVTMSAAKSANAKFVVIPPTGSPLTVYVTGEGEVNSSPAGINGCEASSGTCTGLFEGPVTLTATPGSGYVFAGWIGCAHKSATECEVTVNAPKEVYAVFLKQGTEGQPGQPGETPTITTIPGSPGGECGEAGGIKVTLGAFEEVVCNGEMGTPGTNGSNGTNGAAGPQGPAGPTGPAGAKGDTGAQGAAGPQGPAGPKSKVTCTVKKKGKTRVRVTCAVKYSGVSASSSSARWKLMRGGHTYLHGRTDGRDLIVNVGNLRPGRYVLHLQGQKGSTPIVVS